jgi:nickel/cobalt transporter (NicO) family protein
MSESLAAVLAIGAVTLGSLHTIAPDHWVPFAAISRAQGWSRGRTVRITAMCGFGHVTVSVLLGILALAFGLEMLHVIGQRMEAAAGILLISFGLVYGVLGLRRAAGVRFHGHRHHHYDHVHGPSTMTPWALFLLFSADPCVAVIPILFAAAPLGWLRTTFVVSAYELATIATMVVLVIPARAAAHHLHGNWITRYGDAAAGAVIAAVGVFVAVLGI